MSLRPGIVGCARSMAMTSVIGSVPIRADQQRMVPSYGKIKFAFLHHGMPFVESYSIAICGIIVLLAGWCIGCFLFRASD